MLKTELSKSLEQVVGCIFLAVCSDTARCTFVHLINTDIFVLFFLPLVLTYSSLLFILKATAIILWDHTQPGLKSHRGVVLTASYVNVFSVNYGFDGDGIQAAALQPLLIKRAECITTKILKHFTEGRKRGRRHEKERVISLPNNVRGGGGGIECKECTTVLIIWPSLSTIM